MTPALGLAVVLALAAPGERFVVAVGNDRGFAAERPLRYAGRDAERFVELFTELGGVVADRATLLVDRSPTDVLAALHALVGRVGKDDAVFFYYAGHGDELALHLAGARLPLSDVTAALDGLGAGVRVVVVDSCRTGAGLTERGITVGDDFVIAGSVAPSGVVLLRSSSAGEAALESDELEGAVFSHYLLSGLRGPADADGDNTVALDEAYRYAYSRTLERTAASRPGPQRAGFEVDLAGGGALALTWPRGTSGGVELPAGDDAQYFVYSLPSGNVVAEVEARPDRPVALALWRGRFVVQRRTAHGAAVAQLDLSWGGRRALEIASFRPVPAEGVVARGGGLEPWRWSAGYVLALDGRTAFGPAHGALVMGERRVGAGWAVAVTAGGTWGRARTTLLEGYEVRVPVTLTARWLAEWPAVTASVGAGVVVAPGWQVLSHWPADRLASVGLDRTERLFAVGAGPLAELTAAVRLPAGALVELRFGLGAIVMPSLDGSASDLDRRLVVVPTGTIAAAVGWPL